MIARRQFGPLYVARVHLSKFQVCRSTRAGLGGAAAKLAALSPAAGWLAHGREADDFRQLSRVAGETGRGLKDLSQV